MERSRKISLSASPIFSDVTKEVSLSRAFVTFDAVGKMQESNSVKLDRFEESLLSCEKSGHNSLPLYFEPNAGRREGQAPRVIKAPMARKTVSFWCLATVSWFHPAMKTSVLYINWRIFASFQLVLGKDSTRR